MFFLGASSRTHPEEVRYRQPKYRTTYNKTKYNVSLLRALHSCFWKQFYGIGILKLVADLSNFAGPLLLSALVGFIENKSEDIRLGYAYAAGLGITALICKS